MQSIYHNETTTGRARQPTPHGPARHIQVWLRLQATPVPPPCPTMLRLKDPWLTKLAEVVYQYTCSGSFGHRENAELCLARGRARYHSLSETQKELLAERQRKWYQKNAESCRARNMARYHRLRELRNRPPELPELPAPEPPELPAPEQARQPAREATAVIIVIFPRWSPHSM